MPGDATERSATARDRLSASGGAGARQAAMEDSFVSRLIRALRLDPTLYREVATADSSTYQAVLVVVFTSAVSGIAWGARTFHFIERNEPALVGMDSPMAEVGVMVLFSAVAQVVAWPVWAAGVWAIGRRVATSGRTPGFWSVARVLAFAQTPVAFVVVIPIMTGAFWLGRFDPDGVGEAPLGLLASSVWSAVAVWVLIGTFLATREALGLRNGRTLVTLCGAGVGAGVVAVLVGAAVSSVSRRGNLDYATAYWRGVPSGFDVASGSDFNLGLDFGSAVMGYLFRLFPFISG